MAGLSKLFKPSTNEPSVSSKRSDSTTTSSVNPNCAWVARQKYYRDRRLVTRTDVRARMSVWTRIFSWCRGSRRNAENETMFTVRQ